MTTDAPRDRNELLRRQREGRAAWQALLSRVPLDRFVEPGASGELSVKEIVAHLAAWERRATLQLRRRMRGEREEMQPSMSWSEFEHAFNQQVRAAPLNLGELRSPRH